MKGRGFLGPLVIVLSGCNVLTPDDEPLTLASDFMPLAVGNRWYYSEYPQYWVGDSNRIAVIEEVIATTQINGSTFYVIAYKRSVAQTDSFYVSGYVYYRCLGSRLIEGGNVAGIFSTYVRADFSKQTGEYWVMVVNDKHYNAMVIERDASKITFEYDDPRYADEEITMTYQKGTGMIGVQSLMWGGGSRLVRVELR